MFYLSFVQSVFRYHPWLHTAEAPRVRTGHVKVADCIADKKGFMQPQPPGRHAMGNISALVPVVKDAAPFELKRVIFWLLYCLLICAGGESTDKIAISAEISEIAGTDTSIEDVMKRADAGL
jgi:hypothetical protein